VLFRSQRLDELQTKYIEARSAAMTTLDAVLEPLRAAEAALKTLSDVVTEIEEYRDEFVARAQEDYDSRSENWQASERGEAAMAQINDWESAELPDLDSVERAVSELITEWESFDPPVFSLGENDL
jgi:predicted transcriptional regulator